MNTLKRFSSALLVSATTMLLGSACMASDDPMSTGNDDETEEGATVDSVDEALLAMCPWGYRPLGTVCVPISGNTVDPTPSAQCPGGTMVTPSGNIVCIPPGSSPVFEAPRYRHPRR